MVPLLSRIRLHRMGQCRRSQNPQQFLVRGGSIKNWAFASDFLRLHALCEHGGFYLDTDVELTRPIERFRRYSFVTDFENYHGSFAPATAFMGFRKGENTTNELLSAYGKIRFYDRGAIDMTTNTVRFSRYFQDKFGLVPPYVGATPVHLRRDAVIFPSFYFCTPEPSKPNFSIHHFLESWIKPFSRKPLFYAGRFTLLKIRGDVRRSRPGDYLPRQEQKIFSITCGPRRSFVSAKRS